MKGEGATPMHDSYDYIATHALQLKLCLKLCLHLVEAPIAAIPN